METFDVKVGKITANSFRFTYSKFYKENLIIGAICLRIYYLSIKIKRLHQRILFNLYRSCKVSQVQYLIESASDESNTFTCFGVGITT